jgi:hypothetical protein
VTRKAFEARLDGLGAEGFRALGVASRVLTADHATAAVQRGRIVDSVAHEADHVAEALQCQQYAMLLLRVCSAEQVHLRQLADQSLVGHPLECRASQHARDRNADFGEDVSAHLLVVAGQHLGRDACPSHRPDRGACRRLERIKEDRKTRKHQLRLVADTRPTSAFRWTTRPMSRGPGST